MSKSARLRPSDVRDFHQLAGECRDLGDDPAVWWPHYARRLAGLAAADFAGCGEVADLRRDGGANTLGIGEWGWANGFDREPWDRSVALFDSHPEYTELYRRYFDRLAADPGTCLARTDLMADGEWVRTLSYRELCEPMGVDHYLWCYTPAAGPVGGFGVAVLCRAAGRADFSPRQKAVVRAANDLVVPLIGGPLASFAGPAPTGLPPRVRRVLRCLLDGDSDKQAAARLGVSAFTVNDYAKAIFRHFSVTTRAELLALWVKRGWGGRFAWADGL